jgi:hypothetical protein
MASKASFGIWSTKKVVIKLRSLMILSSFAVVRSGFVAYRELMAGLTD